MSSQISQNPQRKKSIQNEEQNLDKNQQNNDSGNVFLIQSGSMDFANLSQSQDISIDVTGSFNELQFQDNLNNKKQNIKQENNEKQTNKNHEEQKQNNLDNKQIQIKENDINNEQQDNNQKNMENNLKQQTQLKQVKMEISQRKLDNTVMIQQTEQIQLTHQQQQLLEENNDNQPKEKQQYMQNPKKDNVQINQSPQAQINQIQKTTECQFQCQQPPYILQAMEQQKNNQLINQVQKQQKQPQNIKQEQKAQINQRQKNQENQAIKKQEIVQQKPTQLQKQIQQNINIQKIVTKQIFQKKINQSIQFKDQGNIFFKSQKYQDAVKSYSQGLRILDPKDFYGAPLTQYQKMSQVSASLLFNIGSCYFNLSIWRNAQIYYTQTITINPNHMKAFYKRALCRYQMNNYQGAMSDIKIAFNMDKSNLQIYNSYEKILKHYNEQMKKQKQSLKQFSSKMIRSESQTDLTKSQKLIEQKKIIQQNSTQKKNSSDQEQPSGLWGFAPVVLVVGAALFMGYKKWFSK